MSSKTLGIDISDSEVTNVTTHGVWLLTCEGEFFMPYDEFPWFKDMPISKIVNIEEPSPGHFYWPDLDIYLSLAAIRNPEKFPLKAKTDS